MSVNVLIAIKWIKEAWEDVTIFIFTVKNCFHRCGVIPGDLDRERERVISDPFADLD